jgi:hypothetical protein
MDCYSEQNGVLFVNGYILELRDMLILHRKKISEISDMFLMLNLLEYYYNAKFIDKTTIKKYN